MQDWEGRGGGKVFRPLLLFLCGSFPSFRTIPSLLCQFSIIFPFLFLISLLAYIAFTSTYFPVLTTFLHHYFFPSSSSSYRHSPSSFSASSSSPSCSPLALRSSNFDRGFWSGTRCVLRREVFCGSRLSRLCCCDWKTAEGGAEGGGGSGIWTGLEKEDGRVKGR